MNKASAKTNRPLITSPCGDALEVSLISPPLLTAARLVPPSQLESKHVTQSTSEQYAPLGLTTPPIVGSASANSKTQIEKHRLIIVGLSSIQNELIAHLSRQAEIAYMLRQPEKVDAVCTQLEQVHAPVASYFRGLAGQRSGKGDLSHAQKLLERAASHAPRNYRARALLALGSIAEYRQDYKAEAELYRLALEVNHNDVFTVVEARRAIALRACSEGDHRAAVQILENLLPLASKHSYLNAQLLNHLAVEYHHAGRLQDAVRLAQIVCALPLATVYHEFEETRKEIQEDITEQEQRPLIIAAPQVQAEQKREKKQARSSDNDYQIATPLLMVNIEPPAIWKSCPNTQSLIQARVHLCTPIHGPPSPFRK
jgi:tetratricopeptide (TPR) repeat protein